MALLPADALTKKLTWTDFTSKTVAEPAPGESVAAAYTATNYTLGPVMISYVVGSKPDQYAFKQDPIVTVSFSKALSWVGSFALARPQAEKDALLNHEQGHYMLIALCARDYLKDLMVVRNTKYASVKECQQAMNDVGAKYGPRGGQYHTAYDDQVANPFEKSGEQRKWDKAIADAQAGQNLHSCLKSAGLLTTP